MNNKSDMTLEFNKIKEILSSYAITYLGIQKIDELKYSNDINEVLRMQKETTEATSYLLRKNNLPLYSISNIDIILSKLDLGSILNQKELLEVAEILKLSRRLKSYSEEDDVSSDILHFYFDSLYTNQNVENEIYRCILSEDLIDDRASSTLYDIRRNIKNQEAKIKESLSNFIHSSSTSKFLQDDVVTFRNDRYVIPVKQEYKNEIPGFVHDFSSSGSTVFIEPNIVFNLNNEIRELKIKEQLEIERILALLTQMIAPISESLKISLNEIGNIDFAFAKAKYSLEINAFEPKLNKRNYINLKNARHPLIDKDLVVPINIWIGDKFNSLIITGPNTGGKTVTLKTVGLLSMMAGSGLHIPTNENSEIALFDNIYTDIGDEQSIEQSLSTFSSHIVNIVNILNNITSKDLILLDELGSGTDPIEGAALAMSILENLHDKNITTIATTHYSELKTFAIKTPGIENASCEFDTDSLRPTYKLLIGVPGKSNAFIISKKLGLNETILKKASSLVSEDTVKFEDVLGDIEHNRIYAEKERALSKKILEEAKFTKEQADIEKEKLEKKKNEILSKAKQEARDILLNAENEVNDIIKELTNLKTIHSKDANKMAEDNRIKLKKSISDMQKDLIMPSKENVKQIPLSELKIGLKVYIPSLSQEATIVSMPDKKGNLIVNSGIIKLNIHVSQIEASKEKEDSKKVSINNLAKNKSQTISTEINILGLTVDDATSVLDKYLDDAYLASLPEVRIVHGKGSGALRSGIQSYLKNHPHVKSYRIGTFGEGDMGVTIASLK